MAWRGTLVSSTPTRKRYRILHASTYGHRRIKADLAAMGHVCGRHRVVRLIREAGLRVRSHKRWRLVSSSRHALLIAPEPSGSPVRL